MYCAACKDSWPGHQRCPTCGQRLVDMKTLLADARIEELPRLLDLARQFELGRRERAEAARGERSDSDDTTGGDLAPTNQDDTP